MVRAQCNAKKNNFTVDLIKKGNRKLLGKAAPAEEDVKYGHVCRILQVKIQHLCQGL